MWTNGSIIAARRLGRTHPSKRKSVCSANRIPQQSMAESLRVSGACDMTIAKGELPCMARIDYGRTAVIIVLLIVAYCVYRILSPFFPALVWAMVLATVFHPVYRRIAHRIRRQSLASAVTCLLLTLLIVLPVLVLLLLLAGESVGAYRALEQKIKGSGWTSLLMLRETGPYQWLVAKLQTLGMPEPDVSGAAVRAIKTVSEFLVANSASVISGFTRFILDFFIMLLTLYYLLLRGPEIMHELRQLSPLRPEYEERIFEKFRGIAQATFGGTLATAAIHGSAGGVTFWIFGLPSPLLWGAVMAVLSLVPLVGTALVWGPVVIYFLLTGAVGKGLLMLAVFAILIGGIDNVIKPLIIRRGTEINTLLIF